MFEVSRNLNNESNFKINGHNILLVDNKMTIDGKLVPVHIKNRKFGRRFPHVVGNEIYIDVHKIVVESSKIYVDDKLYNISELDEDSTDIFGL